MPYLQDKFLTFGAEIEFANIRGQDRSISQWRDMLNNAGFDWIDIKYEATAGVDAEIVTPPFNPYSAAAKQDIAELFDFITNNGGRVGLVGTGGHVHVGNTAWRVSDYDGSAIETMNNHWILSKQAMRGGRYLDNPCREKMPIALIKDFIKRYAIHQGDFSAIVSRSRRQNRFCRPLDAIADRYSSAWDAADTISDMNRMLGGKFAAVSVDTWARCGTVEFRQHQATLDSTKLFNWCKLIDNMIIHSDCNRINYGGGMVETETPVNPYRNGSRIGILWQSMRVDGGATTRDLMAATGWTAETIRARISEMRSTHGQNAVICHNQQHYGHAYGSSNDHHDLNGYEVPRTIMAQQNDATIRIDQDAGITSIWAGLSDEIFEYFNARRQALS